MSMITVEDAQNRLPELIATTIPGEEILILDGDHVVATLVTMPKRSTEPRVAGGSKGSILYMSPDFDAPMELVDSPRKCPPE